MKKLITFLLIATIFTSKINAQIVQNFSVYKQLTQRGDITFAANTILTCSGGCAAQTTTPPGSGQPATGTAIANNTAWINNNYTMAYVDADGAAAFGGKTTFSSSRSFLDLSNNPGCSVIEAYLTWGGNILTTTADYAKRDSVYMKVPGAATNYIGYKADFLIDNLAGSTNNATQITYQCYKNITTQIRAAGEGDYWVGNVLANTGVTNMCGGWAIVVIYGDETLPLRNLTIYKGYANISSASGGQNLAFGGFFTPPSPAAVNVKLGVFSFEGDQGTVGDTLKFNGTGTFLPVTDALNYQNNFFNSSIDLNGVSKNATTSTNPGNPTYTNTLGFDADIVTLNNATKNYLSNSASTATLRLTTAGDQYWPFMITTAIDVFEPQIVITKDWVDDNGGQVQLGDVITYNLKVRNKGNDPATSVTLTDAFYGAIDYVAGSSQILTGPNSGAKTDGTNDDQVDFNSSTNTLKFRLGNSANGTVGGQMGITAAADSVTTLTFKVKVTNDCQVFSCKDSILNTAYVDYVGFTSAANRNTASSPTGFDAFGCPILGATAIRVIVPPCVLPADTTFNGCVPYILATLTPKRPGYVSFYNSSFAAVNNATATGTYYAVKEVYPGCKDTLVINFTQVCIVPITLLSFDAVYNKNVVNVKWQTSSETNNHHFEIERSIDGIKFEKIGTVPGSINSNTVKTYLFDDAKYAAFKYIFYRLAQVDVDGTIKYSYIKKLSLPDEKVFGIAISSITPNPLKDIAKVKLLANIDATYNIQLLDVLGKQVSTQIVKLYKGENIVQINGANLQAGIYLLECTDASTHKKITAKILKQ